ncbi:hypothetical protein [Arundinibacter roseus]|uniref:Uncharacterized protein n=1 Tax=Arundinibacter roseus TaxID=2070510 RepID=A0A4R4KD42_9BACT|nr:hypothetical protein [Arundinibacter roseus]TDB64401.1 hypothetical protein EZE20_12010 [Arundinibacter roseus]
MKVKAGRARPEQLDALRSQLATLQKNAEQKPPSPDRAAPTTPTPEKTAAERPKGEAYAEKQAELSTEANELRKEQAKLSNLLHKVSPHVDCYELTSRIYELQVQIEGLWDEKKYIERNGLDTGGTFRDRPEKVVPAKSLDDVQHKAVLTVELQRLREKRSKVTRKLENPKSAESKRAEWSIELAQTNARIEELTAQRYVL